jgi:1-deoxy-D-xylulose-5-phosphate reductoisomerase
MVEYNDGSVIAQMASTDMRLPIQYALTYPNRYEAVVKKMDFFDLGCLTFEKPDTSTFKPLKLAYEAGKIGGTMPAILNAANEEAVKLFIHKKIRFLDIGDILEESMNKFNVKKSYELEEVLELDLEVKEYVRSKFN